MKRFFIVLFIISVILAFFISPFASSSPDGLERVAEDKGFIGKGIIIIHSPIPDYSFPFIKNEILKTSISGLLGVIITFFLSYAVAKVIIKKEVK